jgi:hypothetical protein
VRENRPPPPESEDYPPPDESEDFWDEAMEAEWWRMRIRNARQERQLQERHDAFIGPRMPPPSPAVRAQLSRALQAKLPLPPREDGMAYMWSGHNFTVEGMMSGALPPDHEDRMRRYLGDITAIVNETVVDDEKAGFLMKTISDALGCMADLGRIDGEYGPSYVLRYDAALRKKGGDGRAAQNKAEALAKWDGEPKRLWEVNQRDLPPKRRMTSEEVRKLILDEAEEFCPATEPSTAISDDGEKRRACRTRGGAKITPSRLVR